MKNLENMYAQMNSAISAGELAERITEGAAGSTAPKKRSYRRLGGLAAGLAAVCALAVGVGAANNWNYAEAFARIFGEKAENLQEYVPENERVIENTFTYADFSVEAAAVSNSGMYLMLRADAKNGAVFEGSSDYHINVNSENGNFDGYCMNIYVLEESPERIRLRCDLLGEVNGGDVTVSVTNPDAEPGAVWEAEFTAKTAAEELIKEIKGEIGFPMEVIGSDKRLVQGDDLVINAEKIMVSAINARIDGTYSQHNMAAVQYKERVWAEMKNGERVSLQNVATRGEMIILNNGEEAVDGRIYMTFVEPIDINELAAFVFDDERIEF